MMSEDQMEERDCVFNARYPAFCTGHSYPLKADYGATLCEIGEQQLRDKIDHLTAQVEAQGRVIRHLVELGLAAPEWVALEKALTRWLFPTERREI